MLYLCTKQYVLCRRSATTNNNNLKETDEKTFDCGTMPLRCLK